MVSWEMIGHYEIFADSLEEAVKKAEDMELPDNGCYLEGSFQVDEEYSCKI